jgi:outer membrane autotransporter protein
MSRPNTYPQKTLLAVAIAGALAGFAPAAATADTVITSSNSATTTQTWTTGNFTVESGGSVSVSSANSTAGVTAASSGGILSNSGTISASGGDVAYGINNTGMINTLINNGTISGFGGSYEGGGIHNSNTIGALTNNGTISGTEPSANSGYGIDNDVAATISTLTNNNTITGTDTGIINFGTITTLVNSGTISGGASSGIGNIQPGHIGTLTNNGTITGGTDAVFNDGTIGTLTNNGTIQGGLVGVANSGSGVANSGTIDSLTNTGQIQGGATGVLNQGTIGSLTNTGTITGGIYAIFNEAGSSLGAINNSGTLAGDIKNRSSTGLTINGSSSTTFGTLTGASNGTALGTITSDAGVTFSTGNLVLNDNIVAATGGVTNSGAVLQVNQPVTITGNYTQNQAATLQIGVSSGATTAGSLSADAGYGRLVVTGQTNVASQSHITLQSLGYAFAAGQRYVVIASQGGATYNAGTLNYSMNGYTGSVTGAQVSDSTASTEDLVLTVNSAQPGTGSSTPPSTGTSTPPSTGNSATNPNAISALQGLLKYTGVSNAQFLNLYDAALGALQGGSSASANRIGKQLAPGLNSDASTAPTFDTLNVIGAHVDAIRMAQAAGGTGVSTGDDPLQWNAWGQAFGGHASQDERNGVDGYSANYGGLLVGVDRAINDNWRVGGVFSYSNTAINNTGDTAGDTFTVNDYGLLGYASFTGNPWYVNLSAGIVQGHYDESRVLNGITGIDGKASGDFNGQQYVARAQAGYPLALGGLTLTPLASLTYSYLHQGAYTENGGDGGALSVDAAHSSSFKSSLGAKLEKGFSTKYGEIVPDIQAQWVHEYVHTKQVTGAQFAADPTETGFTTVGASPVSDLADLSLGVTVLRANNLSVSLRYELQAGSGFVSQTGIVRLQKTF